jgi:hypothetical protein
MNWTIEKIETLKHLKAAGIDWDAIAAEIGNTKHACKSKFSDLTMSEERKGRLRERKNADNRVRYASQNVLTRIPTRQAASMVIPDSVLADREARWSEPKSLTAWMCGDPPPSRSALAQREVRA